jgi:hypothetical protein
MDLHAFQVLIAEWLAQPTRDDLRAHVDAAVRAHPDWAAELAAWRRTDELLAAPAAALQFIAWGRVRQRFSAAVDADAARSSDEGLDDALAGLRVDDLPVDWTRLHARVSQAVTRDAGRKPATLRRRWILSTAASLAAAAAVLLAVLPHFAGPVLGPAVGPGLAVARLAAPRAVLPNGGVATAIISGPAEISPQPQQFFLVDPIRTTHAEESAVYF